MTLSLRVIDSAADPAVGHVQQFFRNYAAWLGRDLDYQGMSDEMDNLPGAYAAPGGRLFYAELDGRAAGCVGVRPFADGVCEMKRLYVEPELRGHGIGRALALAAIEAARELGHRRVLVDTLPAMRIAVRLYRELGFGDAPAYYRTSVEGEMFLSLELDQWDDSAPHDDARLVHLFDWNRAWARQMREVDPQYFEKLARLQAPEYLWIGCSDSRVPANQIVGLIPGQVFVHRNVANVVVHTDLNCLSVIQFAVDVLKVKHVMVVGHYGCGGVGAALGRERVGLVDLWLRHVVDVHVKHQRMVDALPAERRHDRLCELNVLEQVANVAQTVVVQDAWCRGQSLTVHGWIYGLKDGLMNDLGLNVSAPGQLVPRYAEALGRLAG